MAYTFLKGKLSSYRARYLQLSLSQVFKNSNLQY